MHVGGWLCVNARKSVCVVYSTNIIEEITDKRRWNVRFRCFCYFCCQYYDSCSSCTLWTTLRIQPMLTSRLCSKWNARVPESEANQSKEMCASHELWFTIILWVQSREHFWTLPWFITHSPLLYFNINRFVLWYMLLVLIPNIHRIIRTCMHIMETDKRLKPNPCLIHITDKQNNICTFHDVRYRSFSNMHISITRIFVKSIGIQVHPICINIYRFIIFFGIFIIFYVCYFACIFYVYIAYIGKININIVC